MSATSGFGGGGSVVNGILTLSGNSGGQVGPAGNGNVSTIGGILIDVVGVPGNNELTWNLVGGTEGQVIVTNTAGVPQWRTLFSSDGTVTIDYDPVSESLDFTANAGNIDISELTPEIGGAVNPVMGNINIIGALAPYKNITTYNGGANNLEVRLNDAINWPETTSLTSGTISFDGNQFLHAYGNGGLADNNTFLGNLAGNFTMGVSADENTGLGSSCLSQITTASENLAAGAFALRLLTTGEFNVAAGLGSGENITTGSFNTLLGHSTGDAYISDESSNILIGAAVGGVAGENNTIRIGRDGVGLGEQNAFYAAGIFNRSFGATSRLMFIDSNFKIGSATGGNGTIPIGGGTGPVFNTITEGNGISIVNGANSITISSDAADEFETNAGTAVPAAGVLRILGGQLTNTTGAGNTVSINLDQGDDGEIIIAKTGNASEYGTLVSSDNTVQITPDVSTSGSFNINLRANGGAAGRGAFRATQTFNAPNVMGTLTNLQYFMGAGGGAGLTVDYDPASAFFAGDGAGNECTYTAPVDGIYEFAWSADIQNINSPIRFAGGSQIDPGQGALLRMEFVINGGATTYEYFLNATGDMGPNYSISQVNLRRTNNITSTSDISGFCNFMRTIQIQLSAGDVVTFSLRTANFPTFVATLNDAIGVGQATSNATYVSGYLITPL